MESGFCAYFNPRSPHGERPLTVFFPTCGKLFQSTLPARGATEKLGELNAEYKFQSTLPARGATVACTATLQSWTVFQSTLPARGATRHFTRFADGLDNFNPRSPHGERRCNNYSANAGKHFNPRSPHGERPAPNIFSDGGILISIHAPRTGSDRRGYDRSRRSSISIHAPRTGSDQHTRI